MIQEKKDHFDTKWISNIIWTNGAPSNKTAYKSFLTPEHAWRRKVDMSWSTSRYDNRAQYVQHRDQARQLHPLILRGWSRPWARPWTRLWARLWAGGWAFLPRLGSAVFLLWGWGTRGRFGDAFFLPVLHRGGWTTARLLLATRLLGSTARIPLRLYLWTTLGAGLALSRTGGGFARTGARLRFAGLRTGSAISGTGFTLSRLPSRSWTGMMASLVATGTRPVRNT